jgi:hypothetical protein
MRALLLSVIVLAVPAVADDKGKSKDQAQNFDDLFGAPPPKANLDAMKKATEGMNSASGGDGLAPKVGTIDNEASVLLLSVFAAEVITQDKKLGCQPGGRDKKRVVEWTFDEVPAKGLPFEVCLTMASKAGREMNMSVAIVDARNQRVARAEDVIDFRGRPKLDHVIAYPAPLFKLAGPHFYVVDLDGKEVGRLPIFILSLRPEGSGAPPSEPQEPDG